MRTISDLRVYQRDNLAFWRKKTRGFTLLPYGSGKTPIAIMRMRELVPPKRALVVTTAGTLDKWVGELQEWGNPRWKITRLYGTKRRRLRMLLQPHNVAVINYEGLCVLGTALLGRYQVAFFDEVHRTRNPATAVSRGCAALGIDVGHAYGMTGSPVLESPVDMFGVVRVVSPQTFGTDFDSWRDRYFDRDEDDRSRWTPKPGAMEILTAALHGLSYYKPREELDVEYPEEVHLPPRDFELSPRARDEYRRVEAELQMLVKEQTIRVGDVRARMAKLMQLSRGWIYVGKTAIKIDTKQSMQTLADFLEESRGSRSVVWAVHIPEIALCVALARRMGIRVESIHGSVSLAQRTVIEKRLNQGDVRMLVAHPKCIGEGSNLEAENSYRFSTSWSALQYHQSMGRFTRGEWTKVRRVTFCDQRCVHTIDEQILAAVKAKRNLLREILLSHRLPWKEAHAAAAG